MQRLGEGWVKTLLHFQCVFNLEWNRALGVDRVTDVVLCCGLRQIYSPTTIYFKPQAHRDCPKRNIQGMQESGNMNIKHMISNQQFKSFVCFL